VPKNIEITTNNERRENIITEGGKLSQEVIFMLFLSSTIGN
jgi:hypothetical protein